MPAKPRSASYKSKLAAMQAPKRAPKAAASSPTPAIFRDPLSPPPPMPQLQPSPGVVPTPTPPGWSGTGAPPRIPFPTISVPPEPVEPPFSTMPVPPLSSVWDPLRVDTRRSGTDGPVTPVPSLQPGLPGPPPMAPPGLSGT